MAPRKKAADQQYIRNIRYVPVAVRLGSGRRIDLKPRGMRGDTAPVSEDEMNDEIFLGNLDLLFEVIGDKDAKDVIKKQVTNQQRVHPALNQLRNSHGNEYEKGVVIEDNINEEGPTVAAVNDRGMITRFKAPGTTDQPLPTIPSDVPPEEVADWIARNAKIEEGPEAGLGGLRVTRTETQTTPGEKD